MELLSIASAMRLGREVITLDLYAALGVSADARPEELRKAYRRRVRESHPDLHPEDPTLLARIQEINLAGRVLLDPTTRAAYDRARRDSHADAPSAVRSYAAESGGWWNPSIDECEWVAQAPTERPRTPEGVRWLLGDLRGRTAQAFAEFDTFLFALSPERRLALGTLSIGLALLLLAAVSTRAAREDRPRPVSVSPAMLYP